MIEAAQKAEAQCGLENCLFKMGERVVCYPGFVDKHSPGSLVSSFEVAHSTGVRYSMPERRRGR